MILHLLSDDKFSDYAIEQFETVAPGRNRFIVLVWDDRLECVNIKNKTKVEIIKEGSEELDVLCDNLHKYKAIITNNLSTPSQVKIISNTNKNTQIFWVFWGFELYSSSKNVMAFLGSYTREYYKRQILLQTIRQILKLIFRGKRISANFQIHKKCFERVDFCITHIYEDYLYAMRTLKSNFKWAWYNYYNIEETVGSLKEKLILGDNILIGNSASITNNHIEIFEILSKFNLGNRKLITPVSYGDTPYDELVKKKGADYFSDNFYPIVDFMERESYNQLLLTCNIVIMNQYRQQAMGNIITTLWMGAKVYLSKRSTSYHYLKRLGIHVFSVEDDLKIDNMDALKSLPKELVMHNKLILKEEYSKEKVLAKVKMIVDKITV